MQEARRIETTGDFVIFPFNLSLWKKKAFGDIFSRALKASEGSADVVRIHFDGTIGSSDSDE